MSPEATALLSARQISRHFVRGATSVNAVQEVSLTVAAGEVVALMGPSGCGKTTLLHVLGGLDIPDAGSISLDGADWSTLSPTARAVLRRRRCGFVFQSLALLPMATAFENVDTPLLLDNRRRAERIALVGDMLERVGLAHKADQYPDQLSGGEQQRIAIARALVHRPVVVLADEPTGSLDSTTAQDITAVLVGAARERTAAVVLVTHDERVAAHADRVVRLDSGRIVDTRTLHAAGDS